MVFLLSRDVFNIDQNAFKLELGSSSLSERRG